MDERAQDPSERIVCVDQIPAENNVVRAVLIYIERSGNAIIAYKKRGPIKIRNRVLSVHSVHKCPAPKHDNQKKQLIHILKPTVQSAYSRFRQDFRCCPKLSKHFHVFFRAQLLAPRTQETPLTFSDSWQGGQCFTPESQKDSGPKPKVAAMRRPWVYVQPTVPTAARMWPTSPGPREGKGRNRVAVDDFV
jgi:hypothetical protein